MFITVLLNIIKYAGAVGQIALLEGYFDLLDDLALKWRLDISDARALYLEVSKALVAQNIEAKAQYFLIKHLETFGGVGSEAASFGPHTRSLAAKSVAGAVRNPIVCFQERHNVMSLAAIAALKGDAEYGKLFELLVIFTQGKLRDYLEYAKRCQAVLSAYELDHDSCVDNMRLLSMCSLATEHEEIPYAAIAEDLGVPLEEVEAWVVRTITSGLIDAKMDQLKSRVVITRCTHRVFYHAQWAQLQEKLATWKGNLRSILSTLKKTKGLASRQLAS